MLQHMLYTLSQELERQFVTCAVSKVHDLCQRRRLNYRSASRPFLQLLIVALNLLPHGSSRQQT